MKQRTKDYYIDEINDLKEYIDNIKTYESPNKKPVYNIDNAFTPALLITFVKNMASLIMLMMSIKLAL